MKMNDDNYDDDDDNDDVDDDRDDYLEEIRRGVWCGRRPCR